jgi:hypothetical protein
MSFALWSLLSSESVILLLKSGVAVIDPFLNNLWKRRNGASRTLFSILSRRESQKMMIIDDSRQFQRSVVLVIHSHYIPAPLECR